MKRRIILETLLICIFGILGWYLFSTMKNLESRNLIARSIDNRLTFMSGSGIDVMGNKIDPITKNETDADDCGVTAFLLRYDSLDADIKFWNEVNGIISKFDIVQLIAYCENTQCIDVIKNEPDKVRFSVLEYGEIIDMQAINAADTNGEFWLRRNTVKKIKWRDETLTPFDIAKSIGVGL